MTNIVVTSPKGTDLMHKIENPYDSFWTFKRKPKKLKVKDIVWVVKDGTVFVGFTVRKIVFSKNSVKYARGHNPSNVWRVWFECRIDEEELQEMGILDEDWEPTIKIKGFQGFRYQWWGSDEKR